MAWLIALGSAFAQAWYRVLRVLIRPRRRVVFLSRQSNTPSRDMLALADALRAADPGLEIVIRCRMLGDSATAHVADVFEALRQSRELAAASACVIDGYVIPVSLLDHRPGFFVVQMWHALGAIKKFGFQTLGRPGGHDASLARALRMHRNYDLVLCGGPAAIGAFAEGFGVDPSVVQPLGVPRLDLLRASAEANAAGRPSAGTKKLLAEFPRLADPARTVVLYAPTFRIGGADRYGEVAEAFASGPFTLLIRPHPLETADVRGEHVLDASGADLVDLLPLCAAVVTDYSAIAFEAAAIGVPVYFWVYDHDEYAEAFGLNLDPLTDLGRVSSRTLPPLVEAIGSGAGDAAAMSLLADGYAAAAPGCAERIAARILEEISTRPAGGGR